MLKDLDALDGQDAYPVTVIGTGAAGLTIAHELHKAGIAALLLESGGFERDEAVQDLYAGDAAGYPYDLSASRLRYFGGTTNHWAGQSAPLEPHSLAYRPWVPHSGWPVAYEELAAYFQRAFAICNLGPEVQDAAVLEAFQRPFAPASDVLAPKVFYSSRPIVRFGEAFRGPIESSSVVDLVLNATVTELVTDADGERVTHLTIKNLQGRSVTQPVQFVVLACGGLENPRLLLASRSVRPAGLGNERDLVGRFFMEHPHYRPLSLILHEGTDIASTTGTRLDDLAATAMTVVSPTPRILEERGLLHYGFFLFNQSAALHPGALPGPAARAAAEGTWRGAGPHDRTASGYLIVEQAPNPDSRVTLAQEADALGVPRIVLDWRFNALDRLSLRGASEHLARELTRRGLARVRVQPWVYDPDGPPEAEVGYGNHHMGTTRMGETPLTGVVDRNCRVHSVPNLFVAGSSVFPTSGMVNPTMNIVALALRLADHLRDRVAEGGHLTGTDYRLGTQIDFGGHGRAARFQTGGWSYPEPQGTWTDGREAGLRLDFTEPPNGPLEFAFTAHPFLSAGRLEAQPLEIWAGGRKVFSGRLDRPSSARYQVEIPGELVQDRSLRLRFRLPDAMSPAELGLSSDGRVLGIKVKDAVLRRGAAR